MSDNKNYTYDQVLGSFNGEVARWINDASRVTSRHVPTKEDILDYATEVYDKRYKEVLHLEVLDKYKN